MTAPIEAFRTLVFTGIKRALEIDSHCKSYEGVVTVSYPSYFGAMQATPQRFAVELGCYVLGPERHYIWYGDTLDDALASATVDVTKWIAELETEAAQ